MTAIAEYTFYKLNEYFLKHSDEIDKLIADSEKPPNEIYPKKVAEWLEFRETSQPSSESLVSIMLK